LNDEDKHGNEDDDHSELHRPGEAAAFKSAWLQTTGHTQNYHFFLILSDSFILSFFDSSPSQ